jgi:hypothetical protein
VTRSTMRTLLRRRLQEVTADQWQDSDLNEILNVGYSMVQTAIMKYHPDAFLYRDIRATEANIDLYDWPSGFLTIISVEMKDSSGAYKQIRPMKYKDTLARDSSDTTQRYARVAKYLCLSPAPTSAVAAAIRIWYVPTLSMSADTDIPEVVVPLHFAIVLWSQLVAMGERRETAKETESQLSAILGDIPNWYLVSGDEPATLDFDLGKDLMYGYE